MNKYIVIAVVFLLSVVLISFSYQKKTTIYLIGDSTVADYSLEDDYDSKRYPLVGWGQDYVTENYFMNFPAGQFQAYPNGQKDNTHFQVAGGKAVAKLVFDAMKGL